ncbi:endonuclease/exonuclease/phosphatase family protein [Pseudomonadota bacterium]
MKRISKASRLVLLVLFSLMFAFSANAEATGKPDKAKVKKTKPHKVKNHKAKIKVVTYNLYVGADIFRVFSPTPCGVPQAVNDIHNIIQATNFRERAEAIADQIMLQDPHVIGLQEVSLIRSQSPGNSLAPDGSGIELLGASPQGPRFTFKLDAEYVEYDYLQLLLDALADRGLDYVAVDSASPVNADTEFPAIEFGPDCTPLSIPIDLRLTDRDVILVRADQPVNIALEGNFEFNTPVELPTLIPTPGGLVPAVYVTEFTRGWGAINLTIKDQSYSVVNTHLEVGDEALPPNEGLNLVQYAQAMEIGYVATIFLPPPLLLVGDINSSPLSGFTDPRPAYFVLTQDYGLADVWNIQNKPPAKADFTCCQSELVDNNTSTLDQRIDVILADFGELVPGKIKINVLGDEPGDKTPAGLWPSDHAGVAAKLSFKR